MSARARSAAQTGSRASCVQQSESTCCRHRPDTRLLPETCTHLEMAGRSPRESRRGRVAGLCASHGHRYPCYYLRRQISVPHLCSGGAEGATAHRQSSFQTRPDRPGRVDPKHYGRQPAAAHLRYTLKTVESGRSRGPAMAAGRVPHLWAH